MRSRRGSREIECGVGFGLNLAKIGKKKLEAYHIGCCTSAVRMFEPRDNETCKQMMNSIRK